jgi:hypothetical protein
LVNIGIAVSGNSDLCAMQLNSTIGEIVYVLEKIGIEKGLGKLHGEACFPAPHGVFMVK